VCDERKKWELTCHHEQELPIPHHDKQYILDLFIKRKTLKLAHSVFHMHKAHTNYV
jgi:hypothetical protein